jgi:hypothetical protein
MIFAGIAYGKIGNKDKARSLTQDALALLDGVRNHPLADEMVRTNASNLYQFGKQQVFQ